MPFRLPDIIQFHRFFIAHPVLLREGISDSRTTEVKSRCMLGTDLPGKILELYKFSPRVRSSQNTSKTIQTNANTILHIFPFVTNNIMGCENRKILLSRPRIFDYSRREIMLIPDLRKEISLFEQDRYSDTIILIARIPFRALFSTPLLKVG
jgi:hypothetical protein